MNASVTDYEKLADLLDRSGSAVPPAELHGGLCGVLCASGQRAAEIWLGEFVDDCDGSPELLAELAGALEFLGGETWAALNGAALEFRPLLPEDDEAIEDRAEALAMWCHGFLAGLVIGGLDLSTAGANIPAELDELFRDFAEISKACISSGEREDPDAGDRSLFELVEYVRVGAQWAFEELTDDHGDAAQRIIH